MSTSGDFLAVFGYVAVAGATGTIAGVIMLIGIFTPLSFRYACYCAAPFGLVSALCVHKALRI